MIWRIILTAVLLFGLFITSPLDVMNAQAQELKGPDKRILGQWCDGNNELLFTVKPVNAIIAELTVHGLVDMRYQMQLGKNTIVDGDGKTIYVESTDLYRWKNKRLIFSYAFWTEDNQHYDTSAPIIAVNYTDHINKFNQTYQIQRCK